MQHLNALRLAVLTAAIAVLVIPTASAATFKVQVAKDGVVVTEDTADAALGDDLVVDLTVPFAAKAGCAIRGDQRLDADGVGRSGLKVTVRPGYSDGASVTTTVKVENAELVGLVPMQARTCTGQTPAMLKWDGAAAFDLVTGQPQAFRIGAYSVSVELLTAPMADEASQSSGDLAI